MLDLIDGALFHEPTEKWDENRREYNKRDKPFEMTPIMVERKEEAIRQMIETRKNKKMTVLKRNAEQDFQLFVEAFFEGRSFVSLCKACDLMRIFITVSNDPDFDFDRLFGNEEEEKEDDGDQMEIFEKLTEALNKDHGGKHTHNLKQAEKRIIAANTYTKDVVEAKIIEDFRNNSLKFKAAMAIIDHVNYKLQYSPTRRRFRIIDEQIAKTYKIHERNIAEGKRILVQIGAIEFVETLGKDKGFAKIWRVNPEAFKASKYNNAEEMNQLELKKYNRNRDIIAAFKSGTSLENVEEQNASVVEELQKLMELLG